MARDLHRHGLSHPRAHQIPNGRSPEVVHQAARMTGPLAGASPRGLRQPRDRRGSTPEGAPHSRRAQPVMYHESDDRLESRRQLVDDGINHGVVKESRSRRALFQHRVSAGEAPASRRRSANALASPVVMLLSVRPTECRREMQVDAPFEIRLRLLAIDRVVRDHFLGGIIERELAVGSRRSVAPSRVSQHRYLCHSNPRHYVAHRRFDTWNRYGSRRSVRIAMFVIDRIQLITIHCRHFLGVSCVSTPVCSRSPFSLSCVRLAFGDERNHRLAVSLPPVYPGRNLAHTRTALGFVKVVDCEGGYVRSSFSRPLRSSPARTWRSRSLPR